MSAQNTIFEKEYTIKLKKRKFDLRGALTAFGIVFGIAAAAAGLSVYGRARRGG